MPDLPLTPLLPALRRRLDAHSTVVLQAEPGAGKTTLVPPALLDAGWLAGQTILLLEPRRVAARAAAARIAELLGEPLGVRAGYRVRFDSRVSAQTRIEVLTDGLLTRRLQHDPLLDGVGAVIFDEFHERGLQTDLGLALCLDLQTLRDELRIVVMSATLDGERVAAFLHAPLLHSPGRGHPVECRYLPRDPDGAPELAVARALPEVLAERAGDVLVFLPGVGEIRRAETLLGELAAERDLALVPLYADLPLDAQRAALRGDPTRRRVVLATPVAESSVTIDGVDSVIDTGWSRTPRFEPNSGLSRLVRVRVSRDAADQRAGRAGRLGPGLCLRLWSESTQRGLAAQRPAEILDADLAPLLLELLLWGVGDPHTLRWLDPPPPGALAQARATLSALGALDAAGRLTAPGRRLAGLPLHPRLGRMLLAAGRHTALAADLAALLEERDPLRGEVASGADLRARLDGLDAARRERRGARGRWAAVERSARRLRQRVGRRDGADADSDRRDALAGVDHADAAGALLTLAYPDRIARRRAGDPYRYRLSNGRGARLDERDALAGSDWLAVAEVDAGEREGPIRLAAPLSEAALLACCGADIVVSERIEWDVRAEAVVSVRESRLGALVLHDRALSDPDPAAQRAALIDGLRRLGVDALPWDAGALQLRRRVAGLRVWRPDDGWPDWSDDALLQTLDDWLGPCLGGVTRRGQLQKIDLRAALLARLGWPRRQRLDELAPATLTVPSGSRIRLDYQPDGRPPVLAVKLQELFGLADTPRIAGGRVALMLHLLSPARRPVQVTQDLTGFWRHTYPQLRKELKGRYPKHPWPDDPWSARPTARTRTGRPSSP